MQKTVVVAVSYVVWVPKYKVYQKRVARHKVRVPRDVPCVASKDVQQALLLVSERSSTRGRNGESASGACTVAYGRPTGRPYVRRRSSISQLPQAPWLRTLTCVFVS